MNGDGRAAPPVDSPARASARLLDIRLLGRHQLTAAVTTLVDFTMMVGLVELARIAPPTATLVSATVGGIFNFAVSRLWAFRARHRGSVTSQGARYAIVCAGGAFLNATLLAAVLAIVDPPYIVVRAAVSILVSIAYTFPMHTRFVFRAVQEADEPNGTEPVVARPDEEALTFRLPGPRPTETRVESIGGGSP